MIHIVNGDVVGEKIKGLNGDILVWREMYDFGPLTLDISKENLIKKRADFFEEKLNIPSSLFMSTCQKQNRLLQDLSRTTEITLWFEHDKYDQTMLMYLLYELSSNGFKNLFMVTVDKPIGMERCYALGELSAQQLHERYHTNRQPLTNEQIHEAISGWKAYNSANVNDLEKWIREESHHLPHLLTMFTCHRSYFPNEKSGLNEVEWLSLQALQTGASLFRELFENISKKSEYDGLSDFHFAAILNELMQGEHPLLNSDGPLPNYNQPESNSKVKITSYGLDVLNGKRNRVDLIGINWWVGGVHLQT
jgi:hypothetical protein